MGDVRKMPGKTEAFDVTVCMPDDNTESLQCTDCKVNSDNTLLTLVTVTGRERTYCLNSVLWWEIG